MTTRHYSITLTRPDGSLEILTFPTKEARDTWLRSGGDAQRIKRNYESEDE